MFWLRLGALFCVIGLQLALPQPYVTDTNITAIGPFLDQCPANDPAYAQIRADFDIRHNDLPAPTFKCTEPVSAMPLSDLSEDLTIMQTLRTLYYMDRKRTNYLPWTNLRMYDWLKTKIA